jgi:hypothetical protein
MLGNAHFFFSSITGTLYKDQRSNWKVSFWGHQRSTADIIVSVTCSALSLPINMEKIPIRKNYTCTHHIIIVQCKLLILYMYACLNLITGIKPGWINLFSKSFRIKTVRRNRISKPLMFVNYKYIFCCLFLELCSVKKMACSSGLDERQYNQ